MVGVFSQRGFVLAWVIVIAIGAQSQFVLMFLERLRASQLPNHAQAAANWLNSIPPRIIEFLFASFHLNATIILSSGNIELTTAIFLSFLSPILLLLAFLFLRRAIKSKNFFDDIVALACFYIALQVFVGIWVQAGILPNYVRANVIAILMTIVIFLLTRRAHGWWDSKIFFRGVFLAYLVWAFILPEVVINGTLNALEGFAHFCAELWPNPIPVMQAIAALAGILAAGQLYGISKKPKRPPGPVLDALKVKIAEDVDAAKKLLDE